MTRLGPLVISFACVCGLTGLVLAQTPAKNQGSASAADKPTKAGPYSKISPVDDGGILRIAPGGFPLLAQAFEFNPQTKQAGPSSHSRFAQQTYANTLLDGAHLGKRKRIDFGNLTTPDGDSCAWLGVSFERHARVFISPNYIVAPAEAGIPATGAAQYYALLVFDTSDADKSIAGTLTVRRNRDQAVRFPLRPVATGDTDNIPLAKTGFPMLEIPGVHRNADVISWSVEREGQITHSGFLGFPVVGTVPGLVYYIVSVSEHKTQ